MIWNLQKTIDRKQVWKSGSNDSSFPHAPQEEHELPEGNPIYKIVLPDARSPLLGPATTVRDQIKNSFEAMLGLHLKYIMANQLLPSVVTYLTSIGL